MNPEKQAPHGDPTGWLRGLFGRAVREAPRPRRRYADAVPGSADPRRRRRVPYVNAAGETEWDPRHA